MTRDTAIEHLVMAELRLPQTSDFMTSTKHWVMKKVITALNRGDSKREVYKMLSGIKKKMGLDVAPAVQWAYDLVEEQVF